MVVSHQDYNLAKDDNLHQLPITPAVFGIFAILDEEPVNCRYVAESENLHESVKDLFENKSGEGLQKFMQGPWIKMILFRIMPGSTRDERKAAMKIWVDRYNPKIDNDGEYPGYYGNL